MKCSTQSNHGRVQSISHTFTASITTYITA
jgi:hypothetical protein